MARWERATLPVFGLLLAGCSNSFAGGGVGQGAPRDLTRDDASVITPVDPIAPITVTTLPPAAALDQVAAVLANTAVVDPDLEPGLRTERLNQWRRDRADQCLTITETPNSDDERELAGIRRELLQAPLGHRLVASLAETSTTICVPEAGDGEELFDRPIDALGYQISHLQAVVMNQDLKQGRRVFVAAHELRHSWQGKQIAGFSSLSVAQPYDVAVSFIKEADANAYAVATAWQLRTAGQPAAWNAARRSSFYGPSAHEFRQAVQSFQKQNPGASATGDRAIQAGMRAAFLSWLNTDKVRDNYVEQALNNREKYADNWHGTGEIPPDVAARLGQLPYPERGSPRSYLQPADIGLAVTLASHIAPATDRQPRPDAPAAQLAILPGPR
ncbi:MAG: DUF6782 family putative metallopeptidase [Pseudomonadota bacterium]